MKWVTRERPKIDRIACPWLITRFIDPAPTFLFVPPGRVLAIAEEEEATPFDVPDVALTHVDDRCSFDAFLLTYALSDAPLQQLAAIVRAADTGRLDLVPEAAGLLAISLGLSRVFTDDQVMLQHGLVVYDALYAWCRSAQSESHGWNPEALRAAADRSPPASDSR